MAKHNNVKDLCVDIANAIRAKKGTVDLINPQDFSAEISSITSGGKVWTGHADAEGLRAIGWTDEDITYYQEHGINWNEEDDEYHKVTDDNKALYGVLTANNIADYKERIVYLPKIDTSGVTDMTEMFKECRSIIAIPQLDTRNVVSMASMFHSCYTLVCVSPLDTSKVTDMDSMFYSCITLASIPKFDTGKVIDMGHMFCSCYSLVSIPHFNTSKVMYMDGMFNYCYSLVSIPPLDTGNVTDMTAMFRGDYSIVLVPQLDMSNVEASSNMLNACRSLTHVNIKNSKNSIYFAHAFLLSKESLLYLINNEAATSTITIMLAPYTYERLATDADVVAALNNHPNIALASA